MSTQEPMTEAGKAMVAYLRKDWVRDFNADVAAIESDARAIGAQQEKDRIVKVLVERYQDLLWCNKDDDCDVRADSIRVVLSDLGVNDPQPDEPAPEVGT